MKIFRNIWQRPFPLLILLLLLGFALRLLALDQQSLWWDELKTWERATMPLKDMLTGITAIRNQVPFYYLLMQGWAKLGTEAFILRLFSVFFGLLSIALLYRIGRKLGGQTTGLLAAFLLAISPFHIWYSQEARMYTLLPTLLLLAHTALLRLLEGKNRRWWLLYGLAMTVAIYTHYFAFLVIIVHYIFFVLHFRQMRQQTARWFLVILLVGAAFLPWAWLVTIRTTGYSTAVPGWINPIHWYDPLLTLWVFAIGFGLGTSWLGAVGCGLFLGGVLASFYFFRANRGDFRKRPLSPKMLHIRLLFLWLLIPLVIIFLVSLDHPFLQTGSFSIYNDRYLIIILPPFLLLAAFGWQSLHDGRPIYRFILPLIAFLSLLSLLQQVNNPAFARNDWGEAIAYMQAANTDARVIIGLKDSLLPVSYYGMGDFTFVQIPPPEADEITPAFAEAMQTQLANATEITNQVWHAELYYNQNPHGFPDERNTLVASELDYPAQQWLKAHFTQLEVVRMPGIRFTLYDISTNIQ